MYNSSQSPDFGPRFGLDANGWCPDNNGQCYVAFFDEPYTPTPNYIIVDTDYDSYSLVYSCSNFRAYLWYLSRTATVTQEWRDAMHTRTALMLPNFNFEMLADPTTDDIQGG